MATTNFSGPITAGNIRNTTGTTVGSDVKNTGQVLMSQSFSFTFATEGTATDTNVVIPANSQIVRIDVNVETAFNDSGSDILEVGSSAIMKDGLVAKALAIGAFILPNSSLMFTA